MTTNDQGTKNPHARIEICRWRENDECWHWELNIDGDTEMTSFDLWECSEKQDCVENAKRVAKVLGIEVTDEYGQSVE